MHINSGHSCVDTTDISNPCSAASSIVSLHWQTSKQTIACQGLYSLTHTCSIMQEPTHTVELYGLPPTWHIDGTKINTVILPCTHAFHPTAVLRHFVARDMRCPVCRQGPCEPMDLDLSQVPLDVKTVLKTLEIDNSYASSPDPVDYPLTVEFTPIVDTDSIRSMLCLWAEFVCCVENTGTTQDPDPTQEGTEEITQQVETHYVALNSALVHSWTPRRVPVPASWNTSDSNAQSINGYHRHPTNRYIEEFHLHAPFRRNFFTVMQQWVHRRHSKVRFYIFHPLASQIIQSDLFSLDQLARVPSEIFLHVYDTSRAVILSSVASITLDLAPRRQNMTVLVDTLAVQTLCSNAILLHTQADQQPDQQPDQQRVQEHTQRLQEHTQRVQEHTQYLQDFLLLIL